MSFWSGWSDGKKWFMGIASALIIAGLIGLAKFLLSGGSGLPEQRVPFSATSEPDSFAIQSSFEGTAFVRRDRIVVEVLYGFLSYANLGGYSGPRRVEDIRLSLAAAETNEAAWKQIRRSESHEVGRVLKVGEDLELEPFRATIDVTGLETLAGCWLVFDIAERLPSEATAAGLSHAHTRGDLF